MLRSALAGLCVLLAGPADAQSGGGSFDCRQTVSEAEQLVCETPYLARLDSELARVFALAINGPNIGDRANRLRGTQRGWVRSRDACWADDDPLTCVTAAYAGRIHELRMGYPDARVADAEGISRGPFDYTCIGLDPVVSVTFLSADPAIASVAWGDRMVALTAAPAASGTRYQGRSHDGAMIFWTKGAEAQLKLPGDDSRTCRQTDAG